MERNIRSLSMCTMALAVGLFALLTPPRAVADDDDPPSRVARLSYARGSVSLEPAGTDDWVNAVLNRPITTGDKLWADDGSRAELHLGPASIRMSDRTGFSFLNLTDNTAQLQLTAGTLRVRVKRLGDNENFEIDTPNLAFSILRPGVYKIHVDEDGSSTVIKVRSGEGEVTGGGSAYTVHAREAATFSGTDELIADFNTPWDDDDGFDAWCADRDRREDRSLSRRYVSDDVVGYEDLDEYGGWRPVPGYGNVWFPRTEIVGWAPYRYGHWAYVYPWGYTWIDDAPWGFAPFHYGRWINYGSVWGWVPCPPPAPGVVYVRPVYAPALVAWVGGSHFAVGVSVGGGGGGVGWFPLGPREVYVPSYPVSRTYITNVNVTNTTVNQTVINNYYNNTTVINRNTTVINNNVQIHQTYVNQTVPGAVTATTSQAFTSAQPVARNTIRVNEREVATAQVSTFTPAVAPAKQAVLGTGGAAAVKPPAAVQSRAVVAKDTPPPPPVPFAKQQQAIQANGGKPLAISQERQIQPVTSEAVHPAVKIAPPIQNVQGGRPSQLNNPGNQPGQPSAGGNKPANANARGQGLGNAGNKPGFANGGQPGGNTPGNGNANTGGQGQGNAGNKPSFANGGQPGGNTPGNGNANASGEGRGNAGNKPSFANGGQPGGSTPGNGNHGFGDRPPSARPSGDDATNGGKAGGGSANNSSNAASGGNATHSGNAGGGNADSKPSFANGGQPGGNTPSNGNRGFGDRPPSGRPGGDANGGNAGGPSVNNSGNAGGGGVAIHRSDASAGSADNNRGSNGGSITPADVRHQQELEQLRGRQDQDRQRLDQQQQQERQRLARQADDERRQRELSQKHDQQLPALEPKHDNQQQRVEQKPPDERRKDASTSRDTPKDKPKDKPGQNDHPRGGDHPNDKN